MSTQRVLINAAMPKVSQKGANYQAVIYGGTNQAIAGASNGDFTKFIGQEIEVELEASKDGKTMFIKLPGSEGANAPKKPFQSYPKQDPELEKRKFALSIGVDICKLVKFTLDEFKAYTLAAKHYLDEGKFSEKSS